MLKQAEYILTRFRETHKENFARCAVELIASDRIESLKKKDKTISEDEKWSHQLMVTLAEDIESDLFRGTYKQHFSNIPMFVLQLKKYQQSLFNDTTSLYLMNKKYDGTHQAIYKVFQCYLQTLKTIDQVVNCEELLHEALNYLNCAQ